MLKKQCDVCGVKIKDNDNHWSVTIDLDFFGEVTDEEELGANVNGDDFHVCEKCYDQIKSAKTGKLAVDKIETSCPARTHKVMLLVKLLVVLGLMVVKKESKF